MKLFDIHCICHRLALACEDKGDDYKFKRKADEILIELWRFFKNSPKRLQIYMVTFSAKEFDSLAEKKKKNYIKPPKKTCRTRWLSLHAGVDAGFVEYKGLIYTLKKRKMTRRLALQQVVFGQALLIEKHFSKSDRA